MCWVGGVQSDPYNETSQFVWERSGIPILGSLWDNDEPNDSDQNEDHVVISIHGSRKNASLNDETGSKTYRYICESDRSAFV